MAAEPGASRVGHRFALELWRLLAVTGSYLVAGKLALLMAIPPGYATAVWPAAGVALVSALALGWRACPGILLGSFLVNVGISFDASSTAAVLRSVSVALAIASGAALQAWVGALLVRRFVGYPSALERDIDVFRFLMLAGPVSCFVAASAAVTALVWAGFVPAEDANFNWWTWWIGDSIGVVIFAPLGLILFGQPRQAWRARSLTVGTPLVVGFAAITLLFIRVSSWENARLRTEFVRRAEIHAHMLAQDVEAYVELARSLGSFRAATPQASCDDWSHFAADALRRHPGVEALSWLARVEKHRRPEFERAARLRGFTNLEIKELTPSETLERAGEREEYFPVECIAPLARHRHALGFDFASDPRRRETLERSKRSGDAAVTPALRLLQDPTGAPGFVIVAPSYAPEHPDEPTSGRLLGFASAVVRTESVVNAGERKSDRQGTTLRLVDRGEPGEGRVIYSDEVQPAPRSEEWVTTLNVAGRSWEAHFSPTPAFIAGRRSWQPWIVLAGGLLCVGLLGGIMLIVTGREARVVEAEAKYRDLYENSPDMYLSIGAEHGEILDCNQTLATKLGFPKAALLGRPVFELYHPDCLPVAAAAFRAFLSSGVVADTELELLKHDGSTLEVSLSATAVRDAAGKIVRSRSVLRDISGRKQLERLRERDRFFQLSVDTVCIVNASTGLLQAVNPAFEKVLGYTSRELLERPLIDFVHPEDRGATLREVQRLAAHGGTSEIANRMRRKDGEYRYFQWRGALDDAGMLYAVARDVTEDMLAARALRQNDESLRASLREREVLLQEVHHRVKNNLQVISSLMNMQSRQLPEGEGRAALAECQSRVQAIALIHEKLYQSKNYASVPFSDYAAGLVDNVFHAVGVHSANIELCVDMEPVSLAVDKAIPCGLILNELVCNSVKHAFPGGRTGVIRVELRRRGGDRVVLSVSDDGVGLPPDIDPEKTHSLGLLLVLTLVQQLDAKLEISRDAGSSFRIEFSAGASS